MHLRRLSPLCFDTCQVLTEICPYNLSTESFLIKSKTIDQWTETWYIYDKRTWSLIDVLQHSPYCKMMTILTWFLVSIMATFSKTHSRMTTAITFSHQYDAGLYHMHAVHNYWSYWENLVLVVILTNQSDKCGSCR